MSLDYFSCVWWMTVQLLRQLEIVMQHTTSSFNYLKIGERLRQAIEMRMRNAINYYMKQINLYQCATLAECTTTSICNDRSIRTERTATAQFNIKCNPVIFQMADIINFHFSHEEWFSFFSIQFYATRCLSEQQQQQQKLKNIQTHDR